MAYELFIDGFDYYATADITKKWQQHSSAAILTGGRRSTNALAIRGTFSNSYIQSKVLTSSSHVSIGFAFYVTTGALGFSVDFYSVSGAQFRLEFVGGTNVFRAGRFGVAADKTSTLSVPNDVWTYVECGLYASDTGSYEVRVNGSPTPWINNANYDTCVYSGQPITHFRINSTYSASGPTYYHFDDLYFAYGDEIKFLGDSRVDTLTLIADSSPQDWVPDSGNAWERLNGTGYVSATTVGSSSLFSPQTLSVSPSIIHGVQIDAHIKKSDAGAKSAATLVKSGATTTAGSDLVLSTDEQLARSSYILNPTTSSEWSKAEIDAMTIGVRVTA